MRLGVIYEPNGNAYYRAIDPMKAMERRGHEVVWPDGDACADPRRYTECEVLHVYRCNSENTHQVLRRLARGGTAITFDNDDDHIHVPKETSGYKYVGGAAGQRTFAATMRVARLARAVTTTSEVLAEKYRSSGVERVSVIPNQLNPAVDRSRHNHKGVVIGWIAAAEHQADIRRLGIADALQRVLNKHPQARVECIGVDLKLRSERYRHDRFVAFQDLPQRIGGFDIGIAPLADIPFNRARSDIKLKEYAASGVPWLASPVGPYRGLGEQQGGWLVPQDGWYEALDRLVSSRAKRWWLGRRARRWARTQTIEAVADRWEQVFVEAAGERA